MAKALWVLGATALLILSMGMIVGGSVMLWKAKEAQTCGDWEADEKYYPQWDCGYTSFNPLSGCDTLCYCVNIKYEYECIENTPEGLSLAMVSGGVILIVLGVMGIVIAIVCYVLKAKD